MAISKDNQRSTDELNDQHNKNGIFTVNDSYNPTKQQRDERIGNEPDTDRLRSERESVQESNENKRS